MSARPRGRPGSDRTAAASRRERFRRAYGAEPLHLLMALATLGFAGFAFVEAVTRPDRVAFLLWFGGAVVGHDLVFFWLYTGARRGLEQGAAGLAGDRAFPVINHFTVPAFVSALLFLVWFPLILGVSAPVYERKVGLPLDPSPYLGRWLLVTAALFSASALAYVLRLAARGGRAVSRSGR